MSVAKHQLFIIDSVFGFSSDTESSAAGNNQDYRQNQSSSFTRQFLTAGKAGELVPATSILPGYEQFSFYTSYLIKGLRDGAADVYRDGVITHGELSRYLERYAKTSLSTPDSGVFQGHESLGSFVFTSPIRSSESISKSSLPSNRLKQLEAHEEEKYDWNLLSSIGIDGLRSYVEKYPKGEYINQANNEISRLLIEESFWQSLEKKSVNDLALYVERYSDGKYSKEANEKIKVLNEKDVRDWEIFSKRGLDGLLSYLEKYPDGQHVTEAINKIAVLENNEEEDWLSMSILGLEGLNLYLAKYPDGKYSGKASNKILLILDKENKDWSLLAPLGINGLTRYKTHYPNGKYVVEANKRIKVILGAGVSDSTKNYKVSRSGLSPDIKIDAISEWIEHVRFSADINVLESYVEKYPNGPMMNEAINILDKLRE